MTSQDADDGSPTGLIGLRVAIGVKVVSPAGWGLGRDVERLNPHAFAEDTPHSLHSLKPTPQFCAKLEYKPVGEGGVKTSCGYLLGV